MGTKRTIMEWFQPRRTLLHGLLYAVMGPPIGGLQFWIYVFVETRIQDGRFATGPDDLMTILLLPVAALSGYLVGVIPAALTGLAAGVAAPFISSRLIRTTLSAAAGAGLSAVWPRGLSDGSVMLAVIGAISGAACAFITHRIDARYA